MDAQIDQDVALVLSLLAAAPHDEYVAAYVISDDSGLTPDRVNDAVSLLVEAALAKWLQTMGTAPFAFTKAMITAKGRREVQRTSLPAVDRAAVDGPAASVHPTLQLFISHASDDRELARKVVALVSTALNLPATTIRCTSVDGYRLAAGANTNEQLRQEVHDSVAFIGIVSQASIRSMYVLFELGARWGAGKNLIPLIAHGVPMSILSGPISGLNALRAENSAQLHQLVDDLGRQLSIRPQSPAVFDRALQDVVATPATGSAGSPTSQAGSQSVVAAAGIPSKLEVHKNHSAIDELTGASVALLKVSIDRIVELKITLPGKETEVFHDITAGHIWKFESHGVPHRMQLTQVNYTKESVFLDVRKDNTSG
jgi:hypothetical protein